MKVTANTVKQKKIVEVEVESKEFTLTVSKEELVAIYALAGKVFGDGRIREITDAIYSSIQEQLSYKTSYDVFKDSLVINNEHRFKQLVDGIK